MRKMLLLLSLAFVSAGGAVAQNEFISGQVLEYGTNRPIADAIVFGKWQGNVGAVVDSFSVCAHVDAAVTDHDGRYRMQTWHLAPLTVQGGPTLDVYAPGYESVPGPLGFVGQPDGTWAVFRRDPRPEVVDVFKDKEAARAATRPNDLYVKPYTGSSSSRLAFLRNQIIGGTTCRDAGESRRNLYPLYRAAYQEAKPIAVTSEQQRALATIRESAKLAWLGLPRTKVRYDDLKVPEQVERDLD